MSAATGTLEDLDARMRHASRAGAPPQVVHALMLDVAKATRQLGFPAQADRIEVSASTLTPMFDMRECRQRRWWHKSRPLDFTEQTRHYREDPL